MIELRRTPYAYRTSHRLEQIDVLMPSGLRAELIRKDLRRSELHPDALAIRPEFLYDAQREIEAYRLLAGLNLGTPVCHELGDDWVLLEKISGVELWQVGDLDSWVAVARWLAMFHSQFEEFASPSPHLMRYDAQFFRLWPERAKHLQPDLRRVISGYELVVTILSELPTTVIHGEFYASNVLVAGGRIAPVDWEMVGIGPGILDLAALVTGWDPAERAQIVAGYGAVDSISLAAARLHLAMQWLTWSSDWSPPAQHRRDWLAEVCEMADLLGL